MNQNANVELSYRNLDGSDAQAIFNFLSPFMELGMLLERDRCDIAKLAEHSIASFAGETMVGFAAVEVYSKKLAELQCLAVDSNYRRLGIGRQLVQWCCDRVSELGIAELMAISSTDEMFLACGFDYSLPNQKRALFFQTAERNHNK